LVYAKALRTSILDVKKMVTGSLQFNGFQLDEAVLHVKTYKGETLDNMSIFAEKFDSKTPTNKDKPTTPFLLTSTNVALKESVIKITDENLNTPQIIFFTNTSVSGSNFKIEGPNVTAQINALALKAKRGFEIEDMRGDFSYTLDSISIQQLDIKTKYSAIKGDITLLAGERGLSDFENKVVFKANFVEGTSINTNDLIGFYGEFGRDLPIELEGDLYGALNNFKVTNANIAMKKSRIKGDFEFKNLLKEGTDYVIVSNNHNIATNYYDLKRLLPNVLGDVLPQVMQDVGKFQFIGNTTLTYKTLKTNGQFISGIGNFNADVFLDNLGSIENASYIGDLEIDRFDIGKLIGTPSVGEVIANVRVDGKGFSVETVDTKIEGTIPSFIFEGYDYKNIMVTGNLKKPLFNGKLTIDDPNVKLNFEGLVDISKEINQYDFKADVDFAELNKLNLFTRDSISVFAGNVIMDMKGTTFDNVEGSIAFHDTFYQNQDDDYFFEDFKITTSTTDTIRAITIDSPDIINGSIVGSYKVKDIPNLFLNSMGALYANYIPREITSNQYLDYDFNIYHKIVEVFVPELKLGENTQVSGSVSSDESKFVLDFSSPEMVAFNNYLGKVSMKVDNNNPLFNTYISVDSIYNGTYDLKNVSIINKTINDTLHIQSEFSGGADKKTKFNLSLYHTLNEEGISVIGINKSNIIYKENTWYINEENNDLNRIVFDEGFNSIELDSLKLNHKNEEILLGGSIKDSTYKDIKLTFKDVDLDNLVPEVDSLRMHGNVNGTLHFLQKENFYYPKSTVVIDGVEINDVAFGDLNLEINGNEDLTKYKINTTLINQSVKSINAVGEIDVTGEEPQIYLNVDLQDFNLHAFSPFGGDNITNIRGFVSGYAQVTGAYNSPNLLGRLNLKESGMKIPYLNTDFNIENNTQVVITKDKFDIAATKITDTKYNTSGVLSGNATHTNFGNWKLDLNITTDNLLVLDTPPDEDALYYGTAFISGEADIHGPIDELTIDVVASTEKNTSFKIPLSDTESIGDDSFIKFLSPKEKEARLRGETVVSKKINGLSLNFELDINNNAEVEIVVDQKSNSSIKGRGAGILLIEINTLGKFKMWGDFQIYEGVYDFRYGGLIQKMFTVERGGNITWDGSPTRARLNLNAKYKLDANPSVLLDDPTVNRKIPVEVVVGITGDIVLPDLNFDIVFPDASSTVKSELEYKLQDSEQREQQALFLVSTGSFVSDVSAGQNALTGTLTERVNGLVADIFANSDSRFKVLPYFEAGTKTIDQETANEFGVELSTRLSDRVLINGKVGVPVGGANDSSIAGDIEVQWLVNDDGSMRVNFFNRQAEIQFIGEDQIFEQGVGISYSVDFDTFKELYKKLFGKEYDPEQEAQEIEVIGDDDSFPVNFKSNKEND